MRTLLSTMGALALLMVPAGLAAQDIAEICQELEQVEVGDWAKYETESPQGSGTMRLARLPEGAAPDEGQWFEMSFQGAMGGAIVQVLAPEWPFQPEDVEAVVVKPTGQPAMRVNQLMLNQMRSQMESPVDTEACEKSELIGTETVEVPAGTFDAYRIRPAEDMAGDAASAVGQVGEMWVSTEVPFGLVQHISAQTSVRLVDSGDGATSSITETPQDMPMAGMGDQ